MEVLERGKQDTYLATPQTRSGLCFHTPANLPSPFFPRWQQPLPKQFNICCCYHQITQHNQPPFCCHLVPFPWITEIFYLSFLFPLLEQLRLDPQCPHAATGMKTSIDLQILNRDHLFQNGFGSGVHTLQMSLGHGKDDENKKNYVMLSGVRLCPP